jgi:hypothetical protein
MRTVDLHPVEPRLLHQSRRGDKALNDILNVGLGGGAWLAKVGDRIELYCGRRQRRQIDQTRTLAPRVADLCPKLATSGLHRL